MIIPTLRVLFEKMTGNDIHGQPVFAAQLAFMVAPVRLKFTDQHTTVRTDSSGSHGHATETVAAVVLLAPATCTAAAGDKLTVVGHKVRVTATHPRYAVTGKLDHYQLDCDAWT